MYIEAMRVATRPDEKKRVLAGLAGVSHLRALEMVETYIDDATYREEAAAAAVKIARAVSGAHRERATAALGKALRESKSEAVCRQAREVMDLFGIEFPPERPDGGSKWRLWTGEGDRPWFINLNGIDGVRGDDRVAYLRTQVRPLKAQEVTLEIGTDDGVKVWLNGEVVHSNNAVRGFKEAEDKPKAALKSCWNVLLLKIAQGGGDWSAAVRIKGADGGRLEGLGMKAE